MEALSPRTLELARSFEEIVKELEVLAGKLPDGERARALDLLAVLRTAAVSVASSVSEDVAKSAVESVHGHLVGLFTSERG